MQGLPRAGAAQSESIRPTPACGKQIADMPAIVLTPLASVSAARPCNCAGSWSTHGLGHGFSGCEQLGGLDQSRVRISRCQSPRLQADALTEKDVDFGRR